MTDKEKLDRLIAEIERRITFFKKQSVRKTTTDDNSCALALQGVLCFYDSMQKEPATSLWHDASEKAEKGKLYLYRTNQNVVDINRSEGKDFPDYCERWAYIDDLLKL